MRRSGRYLAGCLTAALAAASGGPLAAAPPYLSQSPFPPSGTASDSGGPLIVPGPSGRSPDRPFEGFNAKSGRFEPTDGNESTATPELRLSPPAAAVPAPPFPPPTITAKPRYTTSSAAAASGSPVAAPQTDSRWVAVFGDVDRPGSYGLAGETISVGELIERCGIDSQSQGTLRLVRNGRPFGQIHRPQDLLLPGDMIIAEATPPNPRQHVQLGLMNLIDRPVAVMVPSALATVGEVLKLANQTHLSPHDVTVVIGGSHAMPGDQAGPLATGSVLVFNPRSINAAALPELKTHYYPADGTATERSLSTPGMPPAPAPSLTAMPAAPLPAPPAALSDIDPFESLGRPARTESPLEPAHAPPSLFSPPDGELSQLPPVDLLHPPADAAPLQFPRTADSSGSIPVGPPEADPHIVPIPTDALFDPTQPLPTTNPSAGAASTEPIDLPDLPADDAEANDDAGLTFRDLAPTILIGGLLGIATFIGLRRLRGSQLLENISSSPLIERWRGRVLTSVVPARADLTESGRVAVTAPEPVAVEMTVPRSGTPKRAAAAPAEILAAIVADRLALREEPIALPAAMRIDGRSSAWQRRRIDPPETEIAGPHIAPIPLAGPSQTIDKRTDGTTRSTGSAASPAGGRFRIDPAQPIAVPATPRTTDTPFERAQATLQSAGNGD